MIDDNAVFRDTKDAAREAEAELLRELRAEADQAEQAGARPAPAPGSSRLLSAVNPKRPRDPDPRLLASRLYGGSTLVPTYPALWQPMNRCASVDGLKFQRDTSS